MNFNDMSKSLKEAKLKKRGKFEKSTVFPTDLLQLLPLNIGLFSDLSKKCKKKSTKASI